MTRRKRKHASQERGSRYSGMRPVAATFAAAVFLGAWLLFLVQPLIAKFILPWFGGTPMVWTVCMLFFQSVLFLGYAYAHAMDSLLPLRAQTIVHFVLLVAAVALMPITPAADWQPSGTEDPTWHIVCLLAVCLGMPYLLLAATGPLLQAWYRALPGDASPYRLYSISNLGSLLALIGYPFVIDSVLGAGDQTTFWSWLFFAFAIVCSYCAWITLRHGRQEPRTPQSVSSSETDRPTWRQCGLWFSLAMLPTVMLLAVTDQICTDVAAVPFLWILPLTLYLLSFILCFRSLRWCSRNLWAILWAVSVAGTIPVMFLGLGINTSVPVFAQIGVFCSLLFACAMVCHGELVRRKPSPRYLTMFYLILSAGGATGGILVGVVAPQVFPTYVELPLAMAGCTVLLMGVFYFAPESKLYRGQPRWAWCGLLASVLLMMACLTVLFQQQLAGVQSIYRNFYGVLQVKQLPGDDDPEAPLYRLIHGRTMHGMQYSTEPRRRWPTSYYGRDSGVGLAMDLWKPGQTKRVGVIGLGTGTLAAYGNAGDTFRFYEINPAVVQLAERFFLYLDDCPAQVEIITGDARVSLSHESPQRFDVLVLDAFSSDAIPIHLLTDEAFRIYLRHLRRTGILAVHISCEHVDLRPILAGHARRLKLSEVTVQSYADAERGTRAAIWTLLARDAGILQAAPLQAAKSRPANRRLDWTDDRHSLFDILK